MSQIVTVRTVAELRAEVARWRAAGETVAMVPTMGALHEGHLSLVRLGLEKADRVLASVFVNPTQFGPGEDYSAYPRGEARDASLLEGAGCGLMFAPGVEEMYPDGFSTTVSVGAVAGPLEGEFRPGHFAGVATIVAKLLLQAGPDIAIFGQKDYQQLQVIRRMVRDLDIPVQILGAPTHRDEAGLALSSRNAYLSEAEIAVARKLNQLLRSIGERARAGEAIPALESEAAAALIRAGFSKVDYITIRRADDLQPFGDGRLTGEGRALAAAKLGRARLIDNMAV